MFRLGIFLVLVACRAAIASAQTAYWIATSSPSNWSNPANWSTEKVPCIEDSVVFNSGSTHSCIVDYAVGIRALTIESSYTGVTASILVSNPYSFFVAGTFLQEGGSFISATGGRIEVEGDFASIGGDFFTDTSRFAAPIPIPAFYNCTSPFALLSRQLGGGYHITRGGYLAFKYVERYNPGVLRYAIYDKQYNKLSTVPSLTKELGSNYYELNLNGLADEREFYVLEVLNEKGDREVLRFQFRVEPN